MTKSNHDSDPTLRRRTLLGTLAVGTVGGLTGCSSLPGAGGESSDADTATEAGTDVSTPNAGLSIEWDTYTTEDGSATVEDGSVDGGDLAFSVFKCNTATADGSLGTLDTTLAISFDYEVDPDQWYEDRVFEVHVDEDVIDMEQEDGVSIRAEQGTVTSGSVETSVDVDGDTTLRLGLRPSDVCDNFDHEETRFTVSNLSVERA